LAERDDVLIIGLGRFGRSLASTLTRLGHGVLGVDTDAAVVQSASLELTHVVQADATDPETIRRMGAGDFRKAVVAIGGDMEASILASYALVDLGVPEIYAKAVTEAHGAILRRVGVHTVVFPELDMGKRLAHTMSGRTIDYIELEEGFVLLETTVPMELVGRTLEDAHVRRRHNVTVVCLKRAGGMFTYATPDTVPEAGDLLVIAGPTAKAEAFAALE
jgi:trk system potassium uptake protein TrkA